MIEVDAVIWYWTPGGMRNHVPPGTTGLGRERYVTARECERLLEAAYRTGMNAAKELALEEIRRA